jgi:hypothetical protein
VQVLGCVALLFAVSGCGGASPTTNATRTTGATPPPTQAQFMRQVLVLCPDNNHLIAYQKALTRAINANDLSKGSRIVASSESRAASLFRNLEKLTPPAKDRVPFLRSLAQTHQYLGISARLAAALHTHVAVEVRRFAGFAQNVSDKRTASAVALGLGRCP